MRGPLTSRQPWAQYRAHGDPLPLGPDWIASGAEQLEVPFPQRGAWTAQALNTLALHDSNSNFDTILRDIPPTETQKQVADRIWKCLEEAEEPPAGLDGPAALASLSDGKCLYNEEPSNLANYDYDKLKVLHTTLKPRRLAEVLPQHARSALQRYQTLIEKSASELSAEEPCSIKPYWDPKLRSSDSALTRLIVGLANQGLVTFRTAIKERIGIFCVKKKTPDWIRLIIDNRRVNARHHAPPTARLSTPRSYLDIQFPKTPTDVPIGYGIEADVNDCFYNYYMEELASWFGIDRPGTIEFWRSQGWQHTDIFDDASQQFFNPKDDLMVYPVFRGLCMGWSWSLYFANESVNYIANGMVDRPLREIRDKTPLPDISLGPVTGVYVDNISIIGCDAEQVQEVADRVAAHFAAADIPLTWTTEKPQSVFETVGLILDFKQRTIRNKPKRLWKAFLAGRELLKRRRVSGKLVEIWLGHMTSLFMITPCALSCFFHIYRFVQQHRHHRTILWAAVREEMKLAMGLMWLTSSTLQFDPVLQVDAGDSSSGAYALLTTWSTPYEVSELCKFREVWRFQPLPQRLKRAALSGSRAEVIRALDELESDWSEIHQRPQEVRAVVPFGAGLKTRYADWLIEAARDESSWLRTSSIRTQLKAKPRKKLEMETPTMVMPIPDTLCRRERYSLLWRKRWNNSHRHINEKEAQVCLSSLRRTARVKKLHGKVKVTLTDNLSCLCALERGRASSYGLNKICRTACAYQLSCGIRWRLRHVETMRNPADEDSRFHENKQKPSKLILNNKTQHVNTVGGSVEVPGGEHGEEALRVSAHDSECTPSRPSKPPVRQSKIRGGAFLEIFAGTARLSDEMRRQRRATLQPIDCRFGQHHDLRRRGTQLVILGMIRSGRIRYVHLGTPCTVFSRARHFIKNHRRARDRERDGVELGLFTAEIIETCNRYNVFWSLENPRNSRLFDLPFLHRLLHQEDVFRVNMDFCMYGEAYRKPTSIFTNIPTMSQLAAGCIHQKHSVVLRGSESVRCNGQKKSQPKTQRAGAYPLKLVEKWTEVVGEFLDPHTRDSDIFGAQLEHELRIVCQTATTRSGSISPSSSLRSLFQQFSKVQPEGLEAIIFGQHTNEEAVRRKRRQSRKVKEQPIQSILGGQHSTETA